MSEKTTTEKLQEALRKESSKYVSEKGKLSESFAKFSKLGISTKSSYSLPLKDTIGKTFREQIQVKSL